MVVNAAAYGMYPQNVALPDVVCSLNREGFAKQDICMVLSPEHPVATVVRDANVNAKREDRALSARTIGWFSEFGAVVIPTVGFFIRSQAFFRALFHEQDFPTLSRDSKTLAGLGFSEDDAKRLGPRLTDLGVLVYVSCREGEKADSAVELLRRTGACEAACMKRARSAEAAA